MNPFVILHRRLFTLECYIPVYSGPGVHMSPAFIWIDTVPEKQPYISIYSKNLKTFLSSLVYN